MTNQIIKAAQTKIAFTALFAVAAVIALSPAAAHAADLDGGGYDYFDTFTPADSGYDYVDTYTPANSGYDYVDTYTPANSGYDYVDTYTPSYSTPSYGTTGYGTTGYGTTGYSTGGYGIGGYTAGYGIPVSYSTPAYHAPSYPVAYPQTPVATTPSNYTSTVVAPTTVTDTTTTNTCTGNSCNSDDHSVVNITNPAPVINNNNVVANYAPVTAPVIQTQQYCQAGYAGVYPNCYLNRPAYNQPVVYQQTPYVSLTQVPYTGLELGFWGSIAYWGAFVLFALFAAYLIAVKRVQNNIANYLKSVLFGTDEEVEVTTETAPAAPAPAPAPEVTNGDAIDSFIMSQINRARTA